MAQWLHCQSSKLAVTLAKVSEAEAVAALLICSRSPAATVNECVVSLQVVPALATVQVRVCAVLFFCTVQASVVPDFCEAPSLIRKFLIVPAEVASQPSDEVTVVVQVSAVLPIPQSETASDVEAVPEHPAEMTVRKVLLAKPFHAPPTRMTNAPEPLPAVGLVAVQSLQ